MSTLHIAQQLFCMGSYLQTRHFESMSMRTAS
jgi:hypothetical protein